MRVKTKEKTWSFVSLLHLRISFLNLLNKGENYLVSLKFFDLITGGSGGSIGGAECKTSH
jgi:hypothetical protein